MRRGKRADAEQCHRDGNAGALRELAHERHRAREHDAVPGEDDRPARAVDELERRAAIGVGDRGARDADVAGVRRRRLLVVELARRLLRVLGDVDEHGAGPARGGDGEGLAHGLGDVFGARHQVVVLGDRQRDAGDVGFLEGVRSDEAAADLSGDADNRRRVHHRGRDAGDHVGRARSGRRDGDPDAAARARVSVGHVRRTLFVPHEDVPDRKVEHRVVGRKNGPAGVAEDVRHALAHQAFPQNLRSSPFHSLISLRPRCCTTAVSALFSARGAHSRRSRAATSRRARAAGAADITADFSSSHIGTNSYPVIAPTDAHETSLAYLAMTPVV